MRSDADRDPLRQGQRLREDDRTSTAATGCEAGQVVAQIESPEIDQQYAAAVGRPRAQAAQSRALAELFSKGNTTQVAMLQAETDARVAEDNVEGARRP